MQTKHHLVFGNITYQLNSPIPRARPEAGPSDYSKRILNGSLGPVLVALGRALWGCSFDTWAPQVT